MRFLLLFTLVFLACQKQPNPPQPPAASTEEDASLKFENEGSLSFLDEKQNPIKTIKIELSDTPQEQEQGMMFRKEMPADTGMLFAFPNEEPRSFWMANTYLSLDIIYANAAKEIVSIAKNAQPLSPESLPSEQPAQYVVEVPAGYTDLHGITPGQSISFTLNK
jgi:uncharacterized protein